MARTSIKNSTNLRPIVTLLIYVALATVLITYIMPIVGVNLPALGKKTFSVKDVVSVVPKSVSKKEEKPSKLTINYDFMDLVKEVSPRDPNTKNVSKISPEFVMGAMVPVALALIYVLAILGLFLAPLKNSIPLFILTGLSVLLSVYVLAGTYYLGGAAQRAFSDSVAKLSDTPFASITQKFVQQVSIQPDYGLYVLLIVTFLAMSLSWYRSAKEVRI